MDDKEKAFFANQRKLNGGRRYNRGDHETGSAGGTVHHGAKRGYIVKRK